MRARPPSLLFRETLVFRYYSIMRKMLRLMSPDRLLPPSLIYATAAIVYAHTCSCHAIEFCILLYDAAHTASSPLPVECRTSLW